MDSTTAESEAKLIVLNGASSSGKSSIAAAVQSLSAIPALHIGADLMRCLVPQRHLPYVSWTDLDGGAHLAFAQAVHRSAAAFFEEGFTVVLDHGLYPPQWLRSCCEVLAAYRPLLVHLTCPQDELARREARRGDRRAGLAQHLAPRIHRHGICDIALDTTQAPPMMLAAQLLAKYDALARDAMARILETQAWMRLYEP